MEKKSIEKILNDVGITIHHPHYRRLIDNIKTYASTQQGCYSKEQAQLIWDMAITFCNNLCVQISDQYNNDDDIKEATAATECAKKIRGYIEQYPPELTRTKEELRNDETLYTYYQLDLNNMPVDYDYTICESLDEVLKELKVLDIHLDDDTPTTNGEPRTVTIQGVGITPIAYKRWREDEMLED